MLWQLKIGMGDNMFKKIAFGFLLSSLFLLIPLKAQAQYLCGGTGLVYSDPVFCQYACGSSCEELTAATTGSSGTCDTTDYEGFVYDSQTGFTYAISKSQNFWTNWTNLATIQNSTDNTALNQIITYYSVSNAWIGAYDPSMSSAYNTNDPQNYVWQSTGTAVSSGYNYWASGQPNNALYQQDIGVIPSNLYGEHWAEMKSDGTWNDEGYHYNFPSSQGYAPYYNALVQWSGPLSCVDGTTPPSTSLGGTTTQLNSTYCNGSSNCWLCTNGTNISECSSGTIFPSGSGELCTYNQTPCVQQTSTPQCPSGYNWNGSSCVSTVSASCPGGYTWNGSTCTETTTTTISACSSGHWNGSQCVTTETKNWTCPYRSLWYECGGSPDRCRGSGTTSSLERYDCSANVTVYYSPSCPSGYYYIGNGECATTTTLTASPTCPSGYTLSGNTCTATTSATCPSGTTLINGECVSYSCPLGGSTQCIEPSGSSTYYCSPYSCSNTATTSPSVTNPSPAPAQTNNGTVTNTGCVGQVYIFSGQAYFCKPAGLQTGGTNCCQSTKDWFGLGSCDASEQKLAQLRSDYECNEVGTYCSESFLGICLQTMQSWCCFGGELAELVQVQVKGGNWSSAGFPSGGGPGEVQPWVAGTGFGSADSPNCGGFTPTQFQNIDFSQVNLKPFYANITTSAAANATGAVNSAESNFSNELTGSNP